MTLSTHYRRLAQAASTVRQDAERLFDARATRASWTLLHSARGVERELWAAYVLALGDEIGRQRTAPIPAYAPVCRTSKRQ